jgi:hypothetical protein
MHLRIYFAWASIESVALWCPLPVLGPILALQNCEASDPGLLQFDAKTDSGKTGPDDHHAWLSFRSHSGDAPH